MNRRRYLATLIRLYLAQPAAPTRASRQDWAVAQTLYHRGVPLDRLAHAIRLATLRRFVRAGQPPPPVRCLAYYRDVLDQLTPEELEPHYVDYVEHRYRRLLPLLPTPASDRRPARSHRQNPAVSDRR